MTLEAVALALSALLLCPRHLTHVAHEQPHTYDCSPVSKLSFSHSLLFAFFHSSIPWELRHVPAGAVRPLEADVRQPGVNRARERTLVQP